MKRSVLLLFTLALIILATGCDAIQSNAFNNATETPKRTLRPTFTPRPSRTAPADVTDTPEVTDTPAAPNTPAASAASDTPEAAAEATATTKPVKTKAPAPKPQPTNPPAPPKPTFLLTIENAPARCDTTTYEIYMTLKKRGNPPRPFAGGYVMAVLDTSGQLLKNGAGQPYTFVTKDDETHDNRFVSNCVRSANDRSPIPYNGKMDVSDAVKMGTKQMIFRFVKSATDMTPISADQSLDFSQPGEYWFSYGAP